MEIKPAYATFLQAKKLKEKGFDLICECFFHNGNFNDDSLGRTASGVIYEAPEQWEIVEWLRVNHGIWVSVDMVYETTQTGFWYSIRQSKEDDMAIASNEYPTSQQAYSAAFDYVLKELI
jgi:predicted CoA-binding protein